jgi:hypothetical protein
VVVSDVEEDADFAEFLKDARAAGFRAVQSTPLFTSDGLLLGIVSTHFANVHEPTPIELKTLQSYCVVAAEHAYRLLGNAVLDDKAKEMHAAMYASILSEARVWMPVIFTRYAFGSTSRRAIQFSSPAFAEG